MHQNVSFLIFIFCKKNYYRNNINQNLKSDQQNKNNLSSLKKGNSSKSNNSSFWMENLTPITNTNRKDKDKSRENISFDLKDNKTNFINNVYAIKKKIIAIPSCNNKL